MNATFITAGIVTRQGWREPNEAVGAYICSLERVELGKVASLRWCEPLTEMQLLYSPAPASPPGDYSAHQLPCASVGRTQTNTHFALTVATMEGQ
jgi:hypothetical protein